MGNVGKSGTPGCAAARAYNPVRTLLGPVIAHLAPARAAYLTGRGFFPSLITPSFGHGLSVAFDFAIAACLVAAVASLLRGGRYVHGEQPEETSPEPVPAGSRPHSDPMASPLALAPDRHPGRDREIVPAPRPRSTPRQARRRRLGSRLLDPGPEPSMPVPGPEPFGLAG